MQIWCSLDEKFESVCERNILRNDAASSRRDNICAFSIAFSYSRNFAFRATWNKEYKLPKIWGTKHLTWSSRNFLASLDFFAARLFLLRRSKYLSSFWSSGIGFFSPRDLFMFVSSLLSVKLDNCEFSLSTI